MGRQELLVVFRFFLARNDQDLWIGVSRDLLTTTL
jgi:hypothetical protein